MRALVLGVLATLLGCDQIFGIDNPTVDAAGTGDARHVDGKLVDGKQLDAPNGVVDAAPATPALAGPATLAVTTSNHITPLTTAIGTGHLIVVVVSIYTLGVDVDTVTDSSNNSYAMAGPIGSEGGSNTGSAGTCEIWYAANSNPVATTEEVNVSLTAPSNHGVWIADFTGVATSAPVDQGAQTSNGSATGSDDTIVGAAITTTVPNELVVTMAKVQETIMSGPSGDFTDLRWQLTVSDARLRYVAAARRARYRAAWISNPAGAATYRAYRRVQARRCCNAHGRSRQ